MDYRDGVCAMTKVESKGCVVLPAGSIFSSKEVLLSEEGIKALSDIIDGPDSHFQDGVCAITGDAAECVAIWGRLAPKRSIMISKGGISTLKNAIGSRPVDYATKATETVKAVAEVVKEAVVDQTSVEPDSIVEEKESADAANARVNREVAEMNLEEARHALANKTDSDDEASLASAIESAKQRLEDAKAAEEAIKG